MMPLTATLLHLKSARRAITTGTATMANPVRQRKSIASAIRLHVGPNTYTVALSRHAIYDMKGAELEGCIIETRRLIVISRIVSPARREEVAEHEFYHAWLFHVPRPKDDEEAAQLHSLIGRQFRADLETAGGPDALLNLRPTRIIVGRPDPTPDLHALISDLTALLAHFRSLAIQLAPGEGNQTK
jgi:hypothetical protein